MKGFSETFDYDNLNRLTHTYADFGNGDVQETAVAYDALGNIISKTGVGVYQYGNQCAGNTAGPHAVCAISAQDQSSNTIGTKNAVYSYDANGNMLSGDGRSITWSLFDKPTQISQNGNTTLMGYGPERQLITRQDSTTAGTTDTVFVGGLYEKITDQNNNIKERHYVGGHTIVTYSNRTASSAGTIETRYLHKDHIGSVVLITDENGNEVESFSFDPWGKRRAPSLADLEAALGNWNSLDAFQKGNLTISALALGSDITNKGFTGHEQMDGVNLIHMGGRVYDAEIGRFLSADPFVQDSTNIQALNRYSYVQNNPLSYTDPSGYFLSGLKSFVKKLVKGVGNIAEFAWRGIWTGVKKIGRAIGEVPALSTAISVGLGILCNGAAAACVSAFNAVMTAANGGTIDQVLVGAAVGYVAGELSSQLGGVFAGQGASAQRLFTANAGAAMLVGGTFTKAQGGKFIDGVKAATIGVAVGYAVRWVIDNRGIIADVFGGGLEDCSRCNVSVEDVPENDAEKYKEYLEQRKAAEDRYDNLEIENGRNQSYSSPLSVDEANDLMIKNVQDSAGKASEIRPFGKGLKKSNIIEKLFVEPNEGEILRGILNGQQGRERLEDYQNYQNREDKPPLYLDND